MMRSHAVLFSAVLALACQSGKKETQATAETNGATAPAPIPAAPAPTAHGTEPARPAAAGSISLVSDRDKVCMVNNQYMGRVQIPTVVEGKTYYGCCPMCKGKLEREVSARTAIDPVSKKTVDKATAVIGQTGNGSVVYFENEDNFRRYAAR